MVFTEESTTAAFCFAAARGYPRFRCVHVAGHAFEILQGIETLPLRMDATWRTHAKSSPFLPATDGRIGRLSGITDHQDHPSHSGCCRRGAARCSVSIQGHARAGPEIRRGLKIFSHLANVGDAKSLVIHPASTTHFRMSAADLVRAGITEGTFVFGRPRESGGPIDDLSRALHAAGKPDEVVGRRERGLRVHGDAFVRRRTADVMVVLAPRTITAWDVAVPPLAYHGRNGVRGDLAGPRSFRGRRVGDDRGDRGWIPELLGAVGARAATLVGPFDGRWPCWSVRARYPESATRIALVGPAAPMSVADTLLDAAKRNDHVAYELITGWSYKSRKTARRQPLPASGSRARDAPDGAHEAGACSMPT